MKIHLSDKFYLEGEQRASLRTKIFREIVANLIVHREYTNGHPCSFVIYQDRVETENANNPHGEGPIDPFNFAPFPKNPTIAKFFIQLGWVEELGSGILNVTKLIKQYAKGTKAQFIEGPAFKMIIPHDLESGTVNGKVNGTVRDTVSGTVNPQRIKPGYHSSPPFLCPSNLKPKAQQIKTKVSTSHKEL